MKHISRRLTQRLSAFATCAAVLGLSGCHTENDGGPIPPAASSSNASLNSPNAVATALGLQVVPYKSNQNVFGGPYATTSSDTSLPGSAPYEFSANWDLFPSLDEIPNTANAINNAINYVLQLSTPVGQVVSNSTFVPGSVGLIGLPGTSGIQLVILTYYDPSPTFPSVIANFLNTFTGTGTGTLPIGDLKQITIATECNGGEGGIGLCAPGVPSLQPSIQTAATKAGITAPVVSNTAPYPYVGEYWRATAAGAKPKTAPLTP